MQPGDVSTELNAPLASTKAKGQLMASNTVAVQGDNIDLTITSGADFGPVSAFLTDVDDDPIDLTGATVTAVMQLVGSRGPVIALTTAIASPATGGELSFSLTAAQTAALATGPARYDWNLWITRGGIVSPIYYGRVSVQEQVF